jgi:hypothetical protein
MALRGLQHALVYYLDGESLKPSAQLWQSRPNKEIMAAWVLQVRLEQVKQTIAAFSRL